MKRLGLSFLALLFALTTAQVAAAKGGKGGKAAGKSKGPAPVAKAADVKEFKGDYKWGMSPQDVIQKLDVKIDEFFKDKVAKYRTDPAMYDKIRAEIKVEKDKVVKSQVKFDGKKSGWDVSIIDEEFVQNNGESMLFYKEPKSTRYFFFQNDGLYKMYVAFDRDVVQGKSFTEFADLMQEKYGKAQPVYRDVATHGMKDKVLDSYQWRSPDGDGLRLVNRSKFYDVYCLVIYDQSIAERQAEVRKNQKASQASGSFVDSVIGKESDRDENDNVVDRITGKDVLKPGERRGGNQNIKVPSPTGEMKSEDRGF
jgi:hypothetical protein